MTQKEEKEYLKIIPRFREVCCSRMCKNWDNCKDLEDNSPSILGCPWLFNYRYTGWPYSKLSYYNYDVKIPDLRVEDIDDQKLKEWLEY